MDAASISRYLTTAFDDIHMATSDGGFFFFCGVERNFPFATVVTKDSYDTASNLDRPDVFRLNIGIGRDTFRSMFVASDEAAEVVHDFTALDRVMPHPVYGSMFWVCVLNPSATTWKIVQPLLAEAHDLAAGRQAKRAPDNS